MSTTATEQDADATTAGLIDEARGLATAVRREIRAHGIESEAGAPGRWIERLDAMARIVQTHVTETRELEHDPVTAAEVCEVLVELTELQQDLREHLIGQRFYSLSRIHDALARLRELPTVEALLQETPEELCHCCEFDRALLSRVRGSTWVPEVLCIAEGQDSAVTEATKQYLSDVEIPLSPMLLETELARRASPALVLDPENHPRTWKDLMGVSQTTSYVAAPVVQGRRVIGFLHADAFGSGRELTTVDRDNLFTFAEGFGMIFERIVLVQRLQEQREQVRSAFRAAERHLDRLADAELRLARTERDTSDVTTTAAAGMFAPSESRLELLLTAREREVLALMVSGARNSAIADQLVISEGTVKSHVKNICRKLRAANRAEAVSKYLRLVMKRRP